MVNHIYVISENRIERVDKAEYLNEINEFEVGPSPSSFIKNQLRIIKLIHRSGSKFTHVILIDKSLILPHIYCKLCRKRSYIFVAQNVSDYLGGQYKNSLLGFGPIIYGNILNLIDKLSYLISDRIIVEAENVIQAMGLRAFRAKVDICPVYVDTDRFYPTKKIDQRDIKIGYISTLDERKGVMQLLKSVGYLSDNNINIIVGGKGPLKEKVTSYIYDQKFNNKVNYIGFVNEEDLPKRLNELRLLVLPTMSEGVPNIMLESMACAVPVLATPVGGIPDVIKDGETGFILENNSPECIAKNVMRALEHPDLERIGENARALMERKFTYEAAVERYKKMLKSF